MVTHRSLAPLSLPTVPLAALAAALWAAPALAQPTDLAYDDGAPTNRLSTVAAGDIEAVRMVPEHPAELVSLRMFFVAGGCTAHIAVWPDNGGNAPDDTRTLWETDLAIPGRGWLTIDVPAGAVTLDPPVNFYVGHVLQDPFCQLAWDSTGSAESHSSARLGGAWYTIVDAGGLGIDALARATVNYFDVRTEFDFVDVTATAGTPNGMGRMAWGDYDGDGDDDLLVDGGRLYRNDGDGAFTDVTAGAGIGDRGTNGGVWADYDNDGHLDFYATVYSMLPDCTDASDCVWCTIISNPDGSYTCGETHTDHTCVDGICMPPSGTRSHDILWHNEGDGTFTDVSEAAGRPYDFFPSEAAAWGDYDNDGFVDLYVANYEKPVEWANGVLGAGTQDKLWHNNGDGTFTEATAAANLPTIAPMCGRGVAWNDYDRDGDLDLYVSNYRLDPNRFFRNNGDGTFTEIGGTNGTRGIGTTDNFGHTIGSTWGDVENDGDWDLFAANLAHPRFIDFSDKSMLYINGGTPDFNFTDAREAAGITYSETHSNPAWGDYDNDGFIDLFLTDIYVGYRSFLYRNEGDVTFRDVTYPSGLVVDNGWGCAWADYDGDGKLDLAARQLWHNRKADTGHWLELRLRGTDSNAAAIGAQVEVTAGGHTMLRQVEGGSGTGVQNSLTLHFGLGDAVTADSVAIHWPSALVETYVDVAADQIVSYVEGEWTPGGDAGDGGDDEADGAGDGPSEAGDGGGNAGGSGCSCRTTAVSPHAGLLLGLCSFAALLVLRRRPTS
jgi:hypothetical protein